MQSVPETPAVEQKQSQHRRCMSVLKSQITTAGWKGPAPAGKCVQTQCALTEGNKSVHNIENGSADVASDHLLRFLGKSLAFEKSSLPSKSMKVSYTEE